MSAMKTIATERLMAWEKEIAAVILEEGDYDLADFDEKDIVGLRHMHAKDAAQTILNWMREEVDPGDMEGNC